jgi:hypothetical protein
VRGDSPQLVLVGEQQVAALVLRRAPGEADRQDIKLEPQPRSGRKSCVEALEQRRRRLPAMTHAIAPPQTPLEQLPSATDQAALLAAIDATGPYTAQLAPIATESGQGVEARQGAVIERIGEIGELGARRGSEQLAGGHGALAYAASSALPVGRVAAENCLFAAVTLS